MFHTPSRRHLSLAHSLTFAAGLVVAGGLGGCGLFRSTKMNYAQSERKDQVRHGEIVQVVVFKVVDGVGQPEVAGVGVILAGLVIEKAIGFASQELQKHLEKVAALHEASYEGRAVITDFNPQSTYDVHIVRSVSKSEQSPTESVIVMRSVYRLTPAPIGPEWPDQGTMIVRRIDAAYEYEEGPLFTHAATRLAKSDEPFEFNAVLNFFTVSEAPAKDETPDAETKKDREPEEAEQQEEQEKPPTLVRRQIGGPIEDNRDVRVGDLVVPPQVKLTATKETAEKRASLKPAAANATPDEKKKLDSAFLKDPVKAGDNALGFFIVDKSVKFLEVSIAVSEKDPSRAAERNTALQQNLKELTPQFIKYIQERAGFKPEAAAQ